MGSSEQILVIPEDFKAALEGFQTLIDEFELEYNKIVSSNIKLSAAWEGEAGSKFREQATIAENVFGKNKESLKIILNSRLKYALDEIVEQDLIIANMINGDPIAERINLINNSNKINFGTVQGGANNKAFSSNTVTNSSDAIRGVGTNNESFISNGANSGSDMLIK